MNNFHTSVLKEEAIKFLNIKSDGLYVDATLGGGGHLSQMFNIKNNIRVIAFDTDKEAIQYSKQVLKKYDDKIIFINKNFSYISSALALNHIKKIDGILFDLGVSLHQIKQEGRGFSFNKDEVLDMRMNQNNHLSAYEVVNFYTLKELARVIREYCEDRYWKRITKRIVESRAIKPISTTFQLKKLIEDIVPKNRSIKSVARIFQAIRIEVNKELDCLEKALNCIVLNLKTGSRIVVISYHSLEDRIVKNFFKYENLECICPSKFPKCICSKEKRLEIITKHPRLPHEEEIKRNSQSRSAKLRVAERC